MARDRRSDSPESAGSGEEVPLDVIPLHSTNLLTVLDDRGVVQYESPSIERILGFDRAELVGEQVAAYFHPDDRESVVAAFRTVVASEEYTVEAVEYRHERADGTYRWVESVASADPTPEGYYVVNTRDVSERKERERELRRKNERLDEFAGVVSHDLRGPLGVAVGRLQRAREECDSEELDRVASAHDRMEALIDDLLTLSSGGKRVAETEPVDPGALAESCWRTVSTADAALVTDVDGPVEADRSRVKQLLENLIRNAVAHGGEDVTVTVGELDEGAGFYVADDGSGIDEDDRERAFSSGFSTGRDGAGLGLTIVREIAEAHGWDVGLEESSEGGLRVEFTGVESP